MPQVGPEPARVDRAVISRRAEVRVGALLVDVDRCGECATHHSEREFKTLSSSASNSDRHGNRREQTEKRNRVVPRAIRARHHVAACHEIPDQVILQHKNRRKSGR